MTFSSLFAAARPTVAVGIAADRVTAIAAARHGGAQVVSAHAAEPLPAGAVVPQLAGANIADRPAVVAALRRTLERLGQRPRRLALALPDTIAKVSLFRFEKVPARADDLEQLIRWQLRKAAPFKIEEGQITWSRGAALDGGGREFVVVLARRDVVQEYEAVCAEAGAHAGLVDLASFGVVDAALGAGAQAADDWLLVHVTPQYVTVAILRGHDLIFYRSRGDEADADLAGLVHQTAMYHEDRLGGGEFAKVLLVAGGTPRRGGDASALRRSLEERLGTGVEVLPDGVRFADRVAGDRASLDLYAPLMGLLLR